MLFMLFFLNQEPLLHKDGSTKEVDKGIAKKPQVVLIHARTLNTELSFLSKTSAARVLEAQRQVSMQLNSPKAKLYRNMPPFLCHHFIDNIFSRS